MLLLLFCLVVHTAIPIHGDPICVNEESSTSSCVPIFRSGCECGCKLYGQENKLKFVVNCTYKGFRDASVLQKLPQETEVLIFKGNSISTLPWNLLGTNTTNPNLKEIDMSSNEIREILGKSYHRVRSVERLILNNNKLKISRDKHHPRIFSNFENLKELHLTDAFDDDTPDDLAQDLHDIFVQSNLTKLIKLHLEQNEIRTFKDPRIFCDFPSLIDIHLGDNYLEQLDFEIQCLSHLRFIDLERNKISTLLGNDLRQLSSLPARNQSLLIDLSNNPLMCDCNIKDFFGWLHTTNVKVRNVETLTCAGGYPEENIGKPIKTLDKFECLPMYGLRESHTSIPVLIGFLVCLLILLIGTLLYMNKEQLRYKFRPILDTVSRKVQYTSIGKEGPEMDV